MNSNASATILTNRCKERLSRYRPVPIAILKLEVVPDLAWASRQDVVLPRCVEQKNSASFFVRSCCVGASRLFGRNFCCYCCFFEWSVGDVDVVAALNDN
jgi:hypothetical protein